MLSIRSGHLGGKCNGHVPADHIFLQIRKLLGALLGKPPQYAISLPFDDSQLFGLRGQSGSDHLKADSCPVGIRLKSLCCASHDPLECEFSVFDLNLVVSAAAAMGESNHGSQRAKYAVMIVHWR